MMPKKSPWIQDVKIKALDIIDRNFSGNTPPTVFVGSKYINSKKANVGILSPLENKEEAWKYDSPYHWYNNNYTINNIIDLRANLINARKMVGITDVRNGSKYLDIAQEIAMSFKTTNIDVELKKKLHKQIKVDSIHLPFGPSGEINKIDVNENLKLQFNVEKIFYDTDLKATEAIKILNEKGIPEYSLSQLLSIGIMGLKYNRKLVPTRWSITATDDTLGKNIIKEIKYNIINPNYKLFFGNYFGNYYLIFIFPEIWGYELFESSMPDLLINKDHEIYTVTDYEGYNGRKNYAENTAGGYYAARLSVLEYFKKNKIQGSALLLRFVTSEYSTPLGVFVVRQAVRKTINLDEVQFDNRKEMLVHGRNLILKRFGYDISNIIKKSVMLSKINSQTKLTQF